MRSANPHPPLPTSAPIPVVFSPRPAGDSPPSELGFSHVMLLVPPIFSWFLDQPQSKTEVTILQKF